MPSVTTSLILAWAKTGIAAAGIFIVLYILYLGILRPIIRKFKKEPGLKEKAKPQIQTEEPKKDNLYLMEDEKVKWVKSAMEKGYKRKDIRKLLKENGRDDEFIEKIVKIYNRLKEEKKENKLPKL